MLEGRHQGDRVLTSKNLVVQSLFPTVVETIRAGLPSSRDKRILRVLQIFSVLGVGGAETWLMSFLKYFREAQDDLPVPIQIDILLTGGTKAVFDDEAIALGAKLFYVPFTRTNPHGFMRKFRRILREGNYDAIHDHQDYVAGLHFLMGAGHLPPICIAHVHNPLLHISNYLNGPTRRLSTAVGKHALRYLATDIVGTSCQVLGDYGFDRKGYPEARLGAAHCGFDVERFRGDPARARADVRYELGLEADAKIVLFVGRLDSHPEPKLNQKNPLFALEIGRVSIARENNVHLVIAGGGDGVKAELAAKVKSWGLENNFHLLGLRSDVPRLMLGSDLLLFPSFAEGLGMVVVEAQAAGLRVLASDTTPRECVVIPDMVQFCSLEKGAESWASDVLRLVELPRPNQATCNSEVRRSAFSIENSAENLLQLYTGVAGGSALPAVP